MARCRPVMLCTPPRGRACRPPSHQTVMISALAPRAGKGDCAPHGNGPACKAGRTARDGRVRLDRPRCAAADPAPHRPGPRPRGDHRPRRLGAQHRGPRRHPVREAGTPAGHAARHAAAPAAAGCVSAEPVGGSLVRRADAALPGDRRAVPRHLHRAAARRLHRPDQVAVAAVQLRAPRVGAGAAPAGPRSHRRDRPWRQSGAGQPPGQARAAAPGARHRPACLAATPRHPGIARGLGDSWRATSA